MAIDLASLGFQIDTSGLKRGQTELGNLAKSAKSAGDAAKGVGDKSQEGATKTRSATEQMRGDFDRLKSSVLAIGGALGVVFSVRELAQAADAYSTVTNRLRLVTDSLEELAVAQAEVFRIAQSGRQPLAETAELYQRIATNQENLALTGAGLSRVVETISKSIAISGANAQGASAALVQLGQAFASGQLRGEELNSVLEQAPALADAIAKGMGTTVGALRQLAEQGKLTSDAVVTALLNQADAVDEAFGRISPTVSQAFQVLGNSATQLAGKMDQASGASAGAAQAIIDLANTLSSPQMIEALNTFAAGAAGAFKVAIEAIGTFVNAVRWLGEEIASRIHGVALNDIVRLQRELETAEARLARNTEAMSRFYAAQAPGEGERAAREIWLKQEAQLRRERDAAFAEINQLTGAIERQRDVTKSATDVLTKSAGELQAYRTGIAAVGQSTAKTAAEMVKLRSVGLALEKMFDAEEKASKDFKDQLQSIIDLSDPLGAELRILGEQIKVIQLAVEAGIIDQAQADKILNGLNRTADGAEDAADRTESAMVSAADRIQEAFAGALGSALVDFDNFGDSLKSAAVRLAGEIAQAGIMDVLKGQVGTDKSALGGLLGAGAASAGPWVAATTGIVVGLQALRDSNVASFEHLTAAVVQAEQNAGTVLGDVNAKSGSLVNSLTALESISGDTLNVNREQLMALRDLSERIGALAVSIVRGVAMPSGDSTLDSAPISGDAMGAAILGFTELSSSLSSGLMSNTALTILTGGLNKVILTLSSGLFDSLFDGLAKSISSVSRRAIDAGILIGEQTIGDILTGVLDAQQFTMIETTKRRLGKKDRWVDMGLADLDAGITGQLQALFAGVAGVVVDSLGVVTGASVDVISEAVSAIELEQQKLSLMGLTGEEQQKVLNEFISKTLDTIGTGAAEALGVSDLINQWAQMGEGAFETISRLAGETSAFTEVAGRLNLRIPESAQGLVNLSQRIAQMAGGFDKLSAAMGAYYQEFFTQAEREQMRYDDLIEAFNGLGMALPESRMAFRDLVESLDLSTEAGEEMFVRLMELAGTADSVYDVLERRAQEHADEMTQIQADQAKAAEDIARAAADFARSQADAVQAVGDATGGLRNRIFMDLLGTDQARYGYTKSQADALAAILPSLTNVDAITSTVQQITALASQAYSMLDPAAQQQRGAEYIKFLDEIQQQAEERIAAAQQERDERSAQILQDAMREVVQQIQTELAQVVARSASDQRAANQVLESVVAQFSASVQQFGRAGNEVTYA